MLTEKLRDAEQKAGNYDTLEKENASVEFIENEEDLNYETLLHLHQKYQPAENRASQNPHNLPKPVPDYRHPG